MMVALLVLALAAIAVAVVRAMQADGRPVRVRVYYGEKRLMTSVNANTGGN